MKPAALLLAALLVLAGVAVVVSLRQDARPLESPAAVAPELEPSHRRPVPAEALQKDEDGSSEVLRRLDLVLARMDALEARLAEGREPDGNSRRSLKEMPLPSSRLDDQDLEDLRRLVREGLSTRAREVIREELAAEAWKARQDKLVETARFLGKELSLEVEIMDPLVAVLCETGWRFFELERRWADENHDLKEAGRLGREFQSARAKLLKELQRLFKDEEKAARIFLYVASKGDAQSLTLEREDLFALQREWLR